jgi:hypothetical protein
VESPKEPKAPKQTSPKAPKAPKVPKTPAILTPKKPALAPAKTPTVDPADVPLNSIESLTSHLTSRGLIGPLKEDLATLKKVFGRNLSARELDGIIGHDALSAIKGARTLRVYQTDKDVQFVYTVHHASKDMKLAKARVVRSFYKERGKLKAHHDLLILHKPLQGKGIGAAVISDQLKVYERLGVSEIILNSNWIGRYYWSKVGFDVVALTRKQLAAEFKSWLGANGIKDEAASKIVKGVKTMRDLAITTIEDRKVGKEFLLSLEGEIENMRMPVKPGTAIYDRFKQEVTK